VELLLKVGDGVDLDFEHLSDNGDDSLLKQMANIIA